jgi:glycerophosphoryl diester phosphodiesterase
MKESLNQFILDAIDFVTGLRPVSRKPNLKAGKLQIVSHRGEWRNGSTLENTFEAFAAARKLGSWALEMDLHWTADNVVVISHDPGLKRIFLNELEIEKTNFDHLRKVEPRVMRLEEVVRDFSDQHLMLEIKPAQLSAKHMESLSQALKSRQPGKDYHFLSLKPEIFASIKGWPSEVFLPVAELNAEELLNLVLEKNYGGLLGHYLFIKDEMILALHNKKKVVGTGFLSSRAMLAREIHRGVDYLFTNEVRFIQSTLASWESHSSKS